KYADRFYKYKRDAWERQHLEYRELSPDDPNFIEEYRVLLEQSRTDIVTTLEELREIIGSGALQDFECAHLDAYFFGQHLYQPLLHLKNTAIQISPVTLNAGERDFVVDLRKFHDQETGFFEGKELYLLRNMSRGRGIGFFEAGNFHPDFILWLLADQKQYVSFVDPKGIRNLEGPNDPKIRFHETIKEIEARLGDPVVILNSFIISNTPLRQVSWWSDGMTKAEFEDRNVVFQQEDKNTYIRTILTKALAGQSAVTV
ncbi:MAG: DEAD/DEAH box helicase, partial [Planctomycetes bacterium]|nr:DEAD/DEAH box helicase [Planctomycetota bacterium]